MEIINVIDFVKQMQQDFREMPYETTEEAQTQNLISEVICMEILEALEKQTPKKPKIEKEMWFGYVITNNKDYYCPNCQTLLTTDYIAEFFNFCDECGQAIDWEEVEE